MQAKKMWLMVLLTVFAMPVYGQQQPIDSRQYPSNPRQSAVGIRQLPNQRAFPKDNWGRMYAPGFTYRANRVIPENGSNDLPPLWKRLSPNYKSPVGSRPVTPQGSNDQ